MHIDPMPPIAVEGCLHPISRHFIVESHHVPLMSYSPKRHKGSHTLFTLFSYPGNLPRDKGLANRKGNTHGAPQFPPLPCNGSTHLLSKKAKKPTLM